MHQKRPSYERKSLLVDLPPKKFTPLLNEVARWREILGGFYDRFKITGQIELKPYPNSE